MEDCILKFQGITKTFPGVKALDQVTFGIKKGTVHALMGENGAGKSTLIKILAGIHTKYEGEIYLNDQKLNLKSPHDAQKQGISVVHQEIKLAETLSVTENIFLGNLLYRNGLVDWKSMRAKAKDLLDNLGMEIDIDAVVSSLSIAKKQIIEICKSIMHKCEILVMDEPSASLTDKELKVLFGIMDRLVKSGVTIIYISHRMEEIFQLSDQITVLRDGKHIGSVSVNDCDKGQLIKMMVGRTIEREYPKERVRLGGEILRVENLSRKGVFENISFTLRKGEILGLSGLVGSGRTEVIRAMLGIDKLTAGKVIHKGVEIHNDTFRQAIDRGFGLIPEDRKIQGLVQIASVKENISMISIDKILKHGLVCSSKEDIYADEYMKKLSIAAPNTEVEVQYLSGGNQQKVVIAKWLMEDSDIIIMDEPTRGIDVGAKAEIYKLMCKLVKEGKSIIMISSEMPEILGMCDRIIVMHEGEKMGELDAKEANQEAIMAFCV